MKDCKLMKNNSSKERLGFQKGKIRRIISFICLMIMAILFLLIYEINSVINPIIIELSKVKAKSLRCNNFK